MPRQTAFAAALVIGLSAALAVPASVAPASATATADSPGAVRRAADVPVVAGRVVGPGGGPVSGAIVTLYPATWVPGGPLAFPSGGAQVTTDAAGRWSLDPTALVPGVYRIRAGAAALDARWFGGAAAVNAKPVTIGPATARADLNIRLAAMSTVKGVVEANGSRVEGMVVGVEMIDALGPEHATDYFRTSTATDGTYSFVLPSGRYELQVDDPLRELPTRWFGGVRAREDQTVLTVVPGKSMSGVDVDSSFQPVFPGRPRAHPRGPRVPRGVPSRPVDPISQYQGQSRCQPRPKPGTVALAGLLHRRYGPVTIGLSRACQKDRSEHYDGRALDWMVNSENKSQARKGDDFVKWLTMSRGRHIGVMARRLGIMYLIWRDRIWGVYQAQDGWRPYNDCMSRSHQKDTWDNDCHRNHVHISLTWAGARKLTTWWRG